MKNIGQDFGIIFRQLNIFLSHELEGTGILPNETMYIGFLYQKDGVTQDELAKEFSVDKAAITRTLQAMEEKELLVRKSDSGDRRIKRLFLTQKALSYKEKINSIQDKWHNAISSGLSEQDSDNFEKILTQIAQNARNLNR